MAAMSRATRRIVVAHLTERGMNPAEIASELEVSPDTVRRDLREGAPPAPAREPESAAPVAAGLLLPDSAQLRDDLAVLTAACRAARPEDAARFAVHQAAQHVRRWQARSGPHPDSGECAVRADQGRTAPVVRRPVSRGPDAQSGSADAQSGRPAAAASTTTTPRRGGNRAR